MITVCTESGGNLTLNLIEWFGRSSGDLDIRFDGQDAPTLLHQTRCTTYDQLQYNSID